MWASTRPEPVQTGPLLLRKVAASVPPDANSSEPSAVGSPDSSEPNLPEPAVKEPNRNRNRTGGKRGWGTEPANRGRAQGTQVPALTCARCLGQMGQWDGLARKTWGLDVSQGLELCNTCAENQPVEGKRSFKKGCQVARHREV